MQNQFTVYRQFILDAHEVACEGCKKRIEDKFPDLFKKQNPSELVIFRAWKMDKEEETKNFYFAIGDKVKVVDGSYNIDLNGVHRSGIDELFKYNEAEIVALNTGKIYDWLNGDRRCTVNLLLKFPKGQLVYCAPNCVSPVN